MPARNEAPPRRRKPPPRMVTVVRTKQLSPYLTRITVSDPSLDGWPAGDPTGHCKVMLPAAGQVEPSLPTWSENGPVFDESQPRPTIRTYTPRRFNPATNELDIDFVIHDAGPASQWAANARSGQRLAVAGVGRGYAIDPDAKVFHLGGDESSIPAIAVLLERFDPSVTVKVYIELEEGHEPMPMPEHPGSTITWLSRPASHEPGTELLDAFAALTVGDSDRVWVATEAVVVRKIRRALLDSGVTADHLVTRGYWKAGEANHPDGDYAQDV